ncbi:TAP-like protein-domain-containing protein [Trametes maxima]|nr:TAP-like protein-domain-containing protein [Trametes maxima]
MLWQGVRPCYATSLGELGYAAGDISWFPCSGEDVVPGAECGYAIVPLDYFDLNAGVAKVALGRYNATSPNGRKGSVFVNPGGPGNPGVSFATSSGPDMQQLVGDEFDIIGFDPRGIGQTEPVTRCFSSPEARQAFIANTVIDRGYDVASNTWDPSNRYHLVQTQRDADALAKTQFAICAQAMGNTLRYMGTSTVARDVDFITTLLEGSDALINFYGLSYGTIISQFLANMFPHRLGHIVADGVLDAVAWTTEPWYKWYRNWLTGTDDVYKLFISECAKAGPTKCALAKADEDAEALLTRLEAFVDGLYDAPLAVPNATLPGILTSGRARLFLMGTLISPTSWPSSAQILAEAFAGNGTALLNAVNEKDLKDLERSAVSCNDNQPFAPPKPDEVVDELLNDTAHVSRFTFAVATAEPDSGCQFWPVAPPERFAGPWNATLRHPMLLLSNSLDPATPLKSAQAAQQRQGASQAGLLIQDGTGHTTLALPSLCKARAVQAYFANGTLPSNGTICPVDVSPFSENEGPAARSETVRSVSLEDQAALESLRRLADKLFG